MTEGVAIYGGTFDPIHNGHIRSAIELNKLLGVKVKMIPSYLPPHRSLPSSNSDHRLKMLRLAIANIDGLEIDARELDREGTSYTIDTLASFRKEYGAHVPIYWIMGIDAYLLLHEWYEWQGLTDYANLIVIERPDFEDQLPKLEVQVWAKDKQVESLAELSKSEFGSLCHIKLPQVDISATMIRNALQHNQSVEGLLPNPVIEYIEQNGLYRT